MEAKKKTYFIIDFDSTFVKIETLDELASIALLDHPDNHRIITGLKEITRRGMEGKISFNTSLKLRLKLFKANKAHLEKLVKTIKKKISASVLRNKRFFKLYKDNIYIISGGFKDYIIPVFKPFGIPANHILANTFIYNRKGEITGFDERNPLSTNGGKIKVLKKLNLTGKKYVIGDGVTDYEIKKAGLADKFYYFSENVFRDSVSKNADLILPNLDELLYRFRLPRALSYPKSRMKVLFLENVHSAAIDIFKKEGYKVEIVAKALRDYELMEKIGEASVIAIRSKVVLTEMLLKRAKRLLAIGRFGVGVNNIDAKTATDMGIAIFNAPFSNTRSVVELALGEMIMLARNIVPANEDMHKGIWSKSVKNSTELRGKTLGIIGYGNIGSQLSLLAEAFGMRVIYYDVIDKLALGNARQCKNMNEVLKLSDFLSVHVDKSSGGYLITDKEFKIMKDGVIFLNLSRGFAVDPESLYKNLINGKVKGCGLDVYTHEPFPSRAKFEFLLQGLPNVILTPHIAGSTMEAQKNAAEYVSEKIITFINTGGTVMSVNFPNVSLPELKTSHRLIHIHRNVPGVLANLNKVISSFNVNIEGQYLKTNEDIGYVITDVSKTYDKDIVRNLKKVPNTIRVRILY